MKRRYSRPSLSKFGRRNSGSRQFELLLTLDKATLVLKGDVSVERLRGRGRLFEIEKAAAAAAFLRFRKPRPRPES